MKCKILHKSHLTANLVVNGDAELILAFEHNAQKTAAEISAQGSIDNEKIETIVKDIMEGGVKAFELRKIKYDF